MPDAVSPADFGFVRVAAAVPPVKVADVAANLEQVLAFARRADEQGAQLAVFPEMCLTGYTAGDLFHQHLLLDAATDALLALARASSRLRPVLVVGLPVALDGALYNVAAVVSGGQVRALVPKTSIPGYKEYYEERWFSSARDLRAHELILGGRPVPFGADIVFRATNVRRLVFGVEICEDLWGPLPPSSHLALQGARIVLNLSASNDLVGKADYRRALVTQQSARAICAYVYTSAGVGESTQDAVFGGHALVAENGTLLAESSRFDPEGQLLIVDVDLEHLALERAKTTSFVDAAATLDGRPWRTVDVDVAPYSAPPFHRVVEPSPFIPAAGEERTRRSEEIFSIQAAGLAKRLSHTGIEHLVLGLSGGLDSTLALLVSLRAVDLLGLPRDRIHAFSMPGFGTSGRTRGNASRLAQACSVSFQEVDIREGCARHFQDIDQPVDRQDVTFENVQARYRTMLLMSKANQLRGLVVGTGDLSELALGWNTFGGDHLSHYDVNAGVPKTLVRYLVDWASGQPGFEEARDTLRDVLDTPISPELVGDGSSDGVFQKTEDLIGPYALHDFFLYHFARWESRPAKILFLAEQAFRGHYEADELRKWLRVFLTRFFGSQWKRSVMPDGPKVGSVALSPRGDWRMPPDAEIALWLADLE